MHRIVHLDLKGAPWKVHYLEKVILLAKKWGATGILFEWEDTFPYIGDLVAIGSIGGSGGDGVYSVEEVRHLLTFVKDNGLEAIQLVQTMGHMEFVLKHPSFRHLRENPRSAAVLCPSQPGALPLVQLMLQQVLDLQPDAAYLHIGADEVWHLAVCSKCKERAEASKYDKACLYLDHIQALALFVKKLRPNLTILMWDDMLRSIDLHVLKEYKLGQLLEPVVWHYNERASFQILPHVWDKHRQLFPRAWAASAFKGANGSCCIASPMHRYVSNHEAWRDEIQKYNAFINFAGVILTGWSRYDHYATLCELLPVSLPTLEGCLKTLQNEDTTCSNEGAVWAEGAADGEWGGRQVAEDIIAFALLREQCFQFTLADPVSTWLTGWQLDNNYTHPVQIEAIGATADNYLRQLHPLKENITRNLLNLTGVRSTEEWIHTLGRPIINRLCEIRDTVDNRMQMEPGVTPSRYLRN